MLSNLETGAHGMLLEQQRHRRPRAQALGMVSSATSRTVALAKCHRTADARGGIFINLEDLIDNMQAAIRRRNFAAFSKISWAVAIRSITEPPLCAGPAVLHLGEQPHDF